MTGSLLQHYITLCYLLFWITRIRGVIRRVKQPRLRGTGWFFDIPVETGFYEGPGRRILRGYWLRMALPFALDIPAIAMLMTGRTTSLMWIIVALVPAIHLNHVYNVSLAQRQAWQFARVEEGKTIVASAVGLSLTPRRLRDYTNWSLEWVLGLMTMGTVLVLLHLYRAGPEKHSIRMLLWVPAFYLYLQLGILLVKQIIVAWRMPLPIAQTAEHSEAKEAMRKYYLLMCDWSRIAVTVAATIWPLSLSVPRAHFEILIKIWLGVWFAVTAAGTVWVEIRRKQLTDIGLKARPVRMPDLIGEADMARWPLCYQPEVPMVVLKGSRGYSLNLANTATSLGAAYLVGIVLLLLVRVQH